jgi:hypothetical protein
VVKSIESINDRLFKGFYYNGWIFLSFYDEEKLLYFNEKEISGGNASKNSIKEISTNESF